jgi:hypothetical protein
VQYSIIFPHTELAILLSGALTQLAEFFLVCRSLQLNGIKVMRARNVINSQAFPVSISNRTIMNWKAFGRMWP